MSSRLIKGNALSPDSWELIRSAEQLDNFESLDGIDLIVPLEVWLSQQQIITTRSGQTAVWLNSHEVPESIARYLGSLALVALNFPEFKDGRPYTSARELRQRWGFGGEVRAIGDVLRDQLFYMQRCGFDAFLLREDQDLELALTAFQDFKEAYQPSIDQPLPLFRRR